MDTPPAALHCIHLTRARLVLWLPLTGSFVHLSRWGVLATARVQAATSYNSEACPALPAARTSPGSLASPVVFFFILPYTAPHDDLHIPGIPLHLIIFDFLFFPAQSLLCDPINTTGRAWRRISGSRVLLLPQAPVSRKGPVKVPSRRTYTLLVFLRPPRLPHPGLTTALLSFLFPARKYPTTHFFYTGQFGPGARPIARLRAASFGAWSSVCAPRIQLAIGGTRPDCRPLQPSDFAHCPCPRASVAQPLAEAITRFLGRGLTRRSCRPINDFGVWQNPSAPTGWVHFVVAIALASQPVQTSKESVVLAGCAGLFIWIQHIPSFDRSNPFMTPMHSTTLCH